MQPDLEAMTAKVFQISSLIRVTAAALDNDVYRDENGAEQVLRVADTMALQLMDDLDTQTEGPGPSLVDLAFTKWRVVRAESKALASQDAMDESSEIAETSSRMEALGQEIAASTPKTPLDAAAMLQWCVEDADGGFWCDDYRKVQQSVASYLFGLQQ